MNKSAVFYMELLSKRFGPPSAELQSTFEPVLDGKFHGKDDQ